MKSDRPDSYHAKSREDWRQWLQENYRQVNGVWLIIYHKHSQTPSVNYLEAVEEALCFGWIDSKPNKRDGESYYQFFAKRNPKSNWSRLNRERVEGLMGRGLMAKPGLEMIEIAKRNGTWTALEDVQNLVIPQDLQGLFDKNKKAFENYQAFPPSSKRIILEWIQNAKKPVTRQKRIEETVAKAAKNQRANHYRQ